MKNNPKISKLITVYKIEVGDDSTGLSDKDLVIGELKSAETLWEERVSQVINYLGVTEMKIELLLNSGKKIRTEKKNMCK